jgi:hypothetical protein
VGGVPVGGTVGVCGGCMHASGAGCQAVHPLELLATIHDLIRIQACKHGCCWVVGWGGDTGEGWGAGARCSGYLTFCVGWYPPPPPPLGLLTMYVSRTPGPHRALMCSAFLVPFKPPFNIIACWRQDDPPQLPVHRRPFDSATYSWCGRRGPGTLRKGREAPAPADDD